MPEGITYDIHTGSGRSRIDRFRFGRAAGNFLRSFFEWFGELGIFCAGVARAALTPPYEMRELVRQLEDRHGVTGPGTAVRRARGRRPGGRRAGGGSRAGGGRRTLRGRAADEAALNSVIEGRSARARLRGRADERHVSAQVS